MLGVSGTGDIDPQEVPQMCAIWCAEPARPFSTLANESLKMILHPTVLKHIPLDKVISRLIHMIYTAIQDSYRAKLCLGKSHTGQYLADTLRAVVEKFGIQDKIRQICGIVTENASNNAVMVSEMKRFKWAQFEGNQHWIRCYAHILNLIVQSILRLFGTAKNKTTTPENDDDVTSLHSSDICKDDDAEDQICRYVNNPSNHCDDMEIKDSDEDAELDDLQHKLTFEDINDLSDDNEENNLYNSSLCKQTLAKFRTVACKLCKSPNSKMEFVELCQELKCKKPHNIFQDVCTRWNSNFMQLVGIVRCEKAVLAWQKDKKHGLDRKYHINSVDIQLAKHLVSILQVFYEQTLQVLTAGSARLTHIIVFIDEVTELLSSAIKGCGNKYPPALRNACRVGLQLTNKYYTLTDCLPLYRIAMEMFNTYYKPEPNVPITHPPKATKPKTGNIAQLSAAQAARGQSTNDPIDAWLAAALLLDNGSPIDALGRNVLVIPTVGFYKWLLTS
ncbi:hypothetical protein PCANC_27571 [Puccinia coronata f. sp. avenae]|uniref:DUF659 domain-containing protein n=1 Tax=Puccinia coronata f. sp. avenae TaxID=200324 RepID=A0A2N5TIT9_9BASI|nr:hypothetical protein PCANC_27571 [Puccinia coronata f. sp. avenae]